MNAQKVASWFITENGRKFSFYLAGTVTTCTLFANFLPHTLFLEQYKDVIHLYRNGISVPIPPSLKDRFQRTLDLLNMEQIDKVLYSPFYSYGFDITSAGSSFSKFGVIIGLPINFSYDSINDIDRSRIKLSDESIIWNSEEGEILQNSLILSENAQQYAIAREIKLRQSPKLILNTFFSAVSVIGAYGISNHINQKFNFYARPLSLRIILYIFVGIFSIGSYTMAVDVTQNLYEEKVDKELKAMNKVFAEGGREYYTKLLERNRALRKLLGPAGEARYSILGNENYFLRNRHIPLVQRKSFFEHEEGELLS